VAEAPGRIARNLEAVRGRIAAAAARSGRDADAVTLVAVTKTVGAEAVRTLYDLGVRAFGESRVEKGLGEVRALGEPDAAWRFVGHLQRNKAADALAGFRRIDSVENPKLVSVLDAAAAKAGIDRVEILLEVNVSGEAAKYGVSPEEARPLLETAADAERIDVRGLMTMAPLVDDPEEARPVFAALRALRDELRAESGLALPELSMGMTNDFEVAVEEGATMVRVGSALFL
jgi:hypothetical protein